MPRGTTSTVALLHLLRKPLTGYSTIAPLEHVWAFGWFINRLLSTRPSRLALIGTWLIGFPSVLVVLTLLTAIVLRPSVELAAVLVSGAPWILVVVSFTLLVMRVTYAYFQRDDSASA